MGGDEIHKRIEFIKGGEVSTPAMSNLYWKESRIPMIITHIYGLYLTLA